MSGREGLGGVLPTDTVVRDAVAARDLPGLLTVLRLRTRAWALAWERRDTEAVIQTYLNAAESAEAGIAILLSGEVGGEREKQACRRCGSREWGWLRDGGGYSRGLIGCSECRPLDADEHESIDRRDVEALRDALRGLVRLIDSYDWMSKVNGDWACVECRPESDMLEAGFACAYHTAKRLSTRTSDGGR